VNPEKRLKNVENTRKHVVRTVELDSQFWLGWYQLALHHAVHGDTDLASQYGERARALLPVSPYVAGLLAGLAEQRGQHEGGDRNRARNIRPASRARDQESGQRRCRRSGRSDDICPRDARPLHPLAVDLPSPAKTSASVARSPGGDTPFRRLACFPGTRHAGLWADDTRDVDSSPTSPVWRRPRPPTQSPVHRPSSAPIIERKLDGRSRQTSASPRPPDSAQVPEPATLSIPSMASSLQKSSLFARTLHCHSH
jgi:hypothetical protein